MFTFGAPGPAKTDSFRTLPFQSLFCSAADKVAFYLCRQAEGKGQHFGLDIVAAAQVTAEQRCEHVPVGECGLGRSPFPKGGIMEKRPPKGLMLSDFSCIFAMSVLAYIVVVVSTNLGEIS